MTAAAGGSNITALGIGSGGGSGSGSGSGSGGHGNGNGGYNSAALPSSSRPSPLSPLRPSRPSPSPSYSPFGDGRDPTITTGADGRSLRGLARTNGAASAGDIAGRMGDGEGSTTQGEQRYTAAAASVAVASSERSDTSAA
mmetsp:Transcript_26931/g.65998  ORF Transcript_26931/g.65998 Transcript_26931/m.65998 type:complete len:141 (+) Transcript_26931:1027-1449(+)